MGAVKKVIVAGGSGFIGKELVGRLVARGDEVSVLTRKPAHVEGARALRWDGRKAGPWSDEVASADAVVNLAGASIGDGRWTESRKRELVASRLDATNALVAALQRNPGHPRVLVNASAVGYYGPRGDEPLDESEAAGKGFLARLVEQWETAARHAKPLARVAILRFGVVLGRDGGALGKMLLPFRLGAGGPIGNGRQWMSWIAIDDAVRMVEWAIDQASARGVYNAVGPVPVRDRGGAGGRGRAPAPRAPLPAPAPARGPPGGGLADEVLIGGQRVLPTRAEAEGFQFEVRTLDEAFARLFPRS